MRERGPRLAAEAVGTFMLVAIGPGAAAVSRWSSGAVSEVGVALAFGTVILAAVYALGHVSGAHLNPAVTIGFWVARRFPAGEVVPYVVAQLVGAALAAAGVHAVVGPTAAVGALTLPAIPLLGAFGVEAVLTFVLMLVIMAVATDARVAGPVAGLAVGSTVAANAIAAGPLTSAGMNPARSFGPALASGVWTAQWVYWIAPMLGAVLAVLTYDYLRRGTAHDYRIQKRIKVCPSRAVPVHGQLGAEPDGRSTPQLQGEGSVSR